MNLGVVKCGFTLTALFSVWPIFAQSSLEKCGTPERMAYYKSQDPDMAARLQLIEQQVQQYIQEHPLQEGSRAVITIPVVVHVIHDGDAIGVSENISDAQILSQIDVLNEDFRRLNSDASNTPAEFVSVAADLEIEFCMAKRDPNGFLTNGIERIDGGQFSWTTAQVDTDIKPQTFWDPDVYLNIWTVRFGGTSSDILGFASMPGGAADKDGVTVGFNYFGKVGNLSTTFNKGRTATHEIGHWLGLFHIWGDGDCSQDDGIADTPNSSGPHYGCPSYPSNSCNSSDMFMNYMDYVDDDCFNLFTLGQKAKAIGIMNTTRADLKSSLGCVAVPAIQLDVELVDILQPTDVICSGVFRPWIRVRNNGAQTLTSFLINYQLDGQGLQQDQWTGSILTGQTENVLLPTISPGFTSGHTLYIYVSNPNGGADQATSNDEGTVNFDVVVQPGVIYNVPDSQDFELSVFPPADWLLDNPDNDRTWERTTNAGGYGESTAAAYFDNFTGSVLNNPDGTTDYLITKPYDFSFASGSLGLSFDLAYARRSNSSKDSLIVAYSLDCGNTWVPLFAKGGAQLATGVNQTTKFVPTDVQWRTEEVSLNELKGQNKVQFGFRNISDWGNALYIDNINIGYQTVGVRERHKEFAELKVYPNPSEGRFELEAGNLSAEKVKIQVFNMLGKEVYRKEEALNGGYYRTSIDLSNTPAGLYLLRIEAGEGTAYRKVLID